MARSFMKLAGGFVLLLVSVVTMIMTWEAGLLTPLGGVSIAIVSFLGTVLMWQDVLEASRGVEGRHGEKSKADNR
ncbi:hypothetical protein [Paenibacillus ferrarius]|uniref:hypothetical protein n=1 Tax=Paenibacillus ferrarius TaxID=1469647 RepID=UPI003D2829E1